MTETKESAVAELRARGLTPKEVARRLGMRPAEVNDLIRAQARHAADPNAVPRLAGSFVSPGWSAGLGIDAEARAWRDLDPAPDSGRGLLAVLVARENRYAKVSVCAYLVDAYCLGVKDAMGPRTMEPERYEVFVRQYFQHAFTAAPVAVPIELAQGLVHGAVEYARQLGFEPCADFAAAPPQLGRPTGGARITFGDHGRPHYISGPHDDAARVVATLRRTVGEGNFDFTLVSGPAT